MKYLILSLLLALPGSAAIDESEGLPCEWHHIKSQGFGEPNQICVPIQKPKPLTTRWVRVYAMSDELTASCLEGYGIDRKKAFHADLEKDGVKVFNRILQCDSANQPIELGLRSDGVVLWR